MNNIFSTMRIDALIKRALENNGRISWEKKLRIIRILQEGGGKFLSGAYMKDGLTRYPDQLAAHAEFRSFRFPEGSRIGTAPLILSEQDAKLANEELKLSLKPGICLAFWCHSVDEDLIGELVN